MQTLQFSGILTVMIEKRKQGKAGKRMGISHEYHSTHGRRRRSKAGTGLRLAGVIAAILLLSLAVTAILENGEKQSEAVQQSPAAGTAANILAPLPMQEIRSLRGRQRRRYGRGRQWNRRYGGCHAGTVRPRPAGSGGLSGQGV